jgi:ketosteroid isomerase-like protein
VTGAVTDALSVVRQLWDRIDARDRAAFGDLLAEDVVVEWPVTGEVIRGRANVVAVNAEYPEGWSIHVLRVLGAGDEAVSEVEVPLDGVVSRAVSWWTVAGGRVVRAREYWTEPGSEDPPAWRRPYTEHQPSPERQASPERRHR